MIFLGIFFLGGGGAKFKFAPGRQIPSLRHDRTENEDVDTQIIKHSPFYGQKTFADLIRNSGGLSTLDLNIRSIYSKFDELACFIQHINITHSISAICLNECWVSKIMMLQAYIWRVISCFFL